MLKASLPFIERIPAPLSENFQKVKHRFDGAARGRAFSLLHKSFDLGVKKVLDVGCSYGEFLIHFARSSVGVTLHEEEVRILRSLGMRAVCGDICDRATIEVLRKEGGFDVLFVCNIFEHVDAPHNFLRYLTPLLGDEGVLILGVPVFPVPRFLMSFRKFRGALADEHVNFFTRSTLIETIARSGWEVLEARPFFFRSRILDRLLTYFSPQQYIIARKIPHFTYNERRQREAGPRVKHLYFDEV